MAQAKQKPGPAKRKVIGSVSLRGAAEWCCYMFGAAPKRCYDVTYAFLHFAMARAMTRLDTLEAGEKRLIAPSNSPTARVFEAGRCVHSPRRCSLSALPEMPPTSLPTRGVSGLRHPGLRSCVSCRWGSRPRAIVCNAWGSAKDGGAWSSPKVNGVELPYRLAPPLLPLLTAPAVNPSNC